MLNRILTSGLVAGVLAGICVAGLQEVTTTPIILKAEAYEKAAEGHHHAAAPANARAMIVLVHDHAGPSAPQSKADKPDASAASKATAVKEWEPADGLQRSAFTSAATIGAAVGFALMLLAAMIASGETITAQRAALWGAAGFVVTGLAPSVGIPPELPGSVSADLAARQMWWIATAAATGLGLWAIWRTQTLGPILGAVALIAIPHVIGAPHPATFGSTVPAELASHFTSTSLAIQAVLWVLIGTFAGMVWTRFDSISAERSA
jgi:cobalt transporter subunit CbtA